MNGERKYTNEELINNLKTLANKIGKTPSEKDLKKDEDSPSASVYIRWFGTWNNAIEKAGLKILKKGKWSEKELLNPIIELTKKLKIVPSLADIKKHYNISSSTYGNYFGSYLKAIEKVGLKYTRGITCPIWRKWQNFCEEVWKFTFKDKALFNQHLDKYTKPDCYVKSERLIFDAMTTSYITKHKLKELEKYSKYGKIQLWCIWKSTEIQHPNVEYLYPKQIVDFIEKNIENNKKLLEKLNWFVENSEHLKDLSDFYNKKGLIAKYKSLWKKLGRQPNTHDVDKAKNIPDHKTFRKVFGSWRTLLLRVGGDTKQTKYTDEQICSGLKKLYNKIKRVPTTKEVDNFLLLPIGNRLYSRFGSIKKAMLFAGIELNLKCKHCRKPIPIERTRNVFCSNKCGYDYNINSIKEKVCPYCNKKFSTNRINQRIYCSDRCQWKDYNRKHRQRLNKSAIINYHKRKVLKPLLIKNCLYCKKKFKQKTHSQRYCSEVCRLKDWNAKNTMWHPEITEKICPICKKIIKRENHRSWKTITFCSPKCWSKNYYRINQERIKERVRNYRNRKLLNPASDVSDRF